MYDKTPNGVDYETDQMEKSLSSQSIQLRLQKGVRNKLGGTAASRHKYAELFKNKRIGHSASNHVRRFVAERCTTHVIRHNLQDRETTETVDLSNHFKSIPHLDFDQECMLCSAQ